MKRKLLITSPYNISEFESWLSDLALQGLYLNHISHFFGYFICGEPSKMDYRVEISKCSNTFEQQELYLLYGWKQVTSKGNVTIYSCPSEQIREEIHTIPSVQAYTLQNVKRKRTIMLGTLVIWILAAILLSLYILFHNGTPILNLINDGLQMVYYIPANMLLSIIAIKEYRDISTAYKTLKNGNNMNHHISWKKSEVFSNILVACAFPLIALIIVNCYFSCLNMKYSIGDNDNLFSNEKYNIISLKDIEEDDSGIEYDYKICKKTNIFSKEIYNIREDILSSSDNSSLEISYYNLNVKAFVKYTISDLIKSDLQNYNYNNAEVEKIDIPHADNVYIISQDDATYCYISKYTEIIRMRYLGSKNSDDMINLVKEVYK